MKKKQNKKTKPRPSRAIKEIAARLIDEYYDSNAYRERFFEKLARYISKK